MASVKVLAIFIAISMSGAFMLNYFKDNSTNDSSVEFQEVYAELETLEANSALSIATFAGGCFWCMEGPFEALDGVAGVVTGFAGGTVNSPTYQQVVTGGTGHRESAHIFFDESVVSYEKLLETYFWQIDPTDPGGQFADRGEHYTTAIFSHTDEQLEAANQYIAKLQSSGRYETLIVTKVLPFTTFFPAEDYHQNFYQKSAEYYSQYKQGSGRADYIRAMQDKFGDSVLEE